MQIVRLLLSNAIWLFIIGAESVAFAQSPERVNSELIEGPLTGPDALDQALYFSQGRADAEKKVEDLDAFTEKFTAESFDKKTLEQAKDILTTALDQYLIHYADATEEYRETQFSFRMSMKEGNPPGFDFSAGKELLLALGKKALLLLKFPEAEQTPESMYLAAEVLALGNTGKGDEIPLKIAKKFKTSDIAAKAKLLIAANLVQSGRIQAAMKVLLPLEKFKDPEIAAYARYRSAWTSVLLAQENIDKLVKAKAKVLANWKSVMVDASDSEKAPGVTYLSDEATKDLIQFIGDISSTDDATQMFAQNKSAMADAEERIALKFVQANQAGKAIELYRDAIASAQFSSRAPLRHAALLQLLSNEKKYTEMYGLLEKMGKAFAVQKSPWVDYHKEEAALLRAAKSLVLQLISKWAISFEEMSGENKSLNEISRRLSKMYVQLGGGAGDKKTQQRLAGLLSGQKDYKSAAEAYFKIAKSAKPKSKARKKSLRAGLLALDKLNSNNGPMEYRAKAGPIAATAKLTLTHNTEFIAEFPQEAFSVERKFSSAAIYFRFGHNEDAEKLLLEISSLKQEDPYKKKSEMLLVTYYTETKKWKQAAVFAKRVLAVPADYSKEDLALAKNAVIRQGLTAAKEQVNKKDFGEAISSYLKLLTDFADSPELNSDIHVLALDLAKKGRADLLIKLAEGGTKEPVTTETYKFLLTQLADTYELTNELDKAQALRSRFIKEFDHDPLTPSQFFRLARLALALGNSDLAALTFVAIPKKFPQSDLAATAAIQAGDLFIKLENKKAGSEAFSLVGKVAGKKSKGDQFKGAATAYAQSGEMISGLEKRTKEFALALAKFAPAERSESGKYFLAALYEIIKKYSDKEIDEPLAEIPLEQYLTMKPLKIGLIEEALAVLKTTGDDEYVLAGTFEVGRVWAELGRILIDQVPNSKRDRKALSAGVKMAKNKSDEYFNQVFRMLDGNAGSFTLSRSVREGLSAYFPEKYRLTVYPILRPAVTRHIMDYQ
jgi:TolA-binding protein